MKIIQLSTLILIISAVQHSVLAQQADQSSHKTITIQSTGEAHIPADLILFHVNITQSNGDARVAFREHKRQENFLTAMLLEEGVNEQHITANPISISTVRRHNERPGFETRQQVQIQLDDITQFESMQIALIENGFVNFSGNFTSSKIAEAQNEALKNAVSEAKLKAELLAEAAGLQVQEVLFIDYGTRNDYSPTLRGVSMAYEADSGSLLQFEHMIPVRENVRIVYRIGG